MGKQNLAVGTPVGSLVALVVYAASATSASASLGGSLTIHCDRDLASRVSEVAATINRGGSPELRELLRGETRVAQFSNGG